MPHAENAVKINKPPAEVFEFLADGLNNARWRPPVLEVKLRTGESGKQGAEYDQTMKGPLGAKIAGAYKLTDVTPNTRIEFVVTAGPARPTGEFVLTEDGGGTSVAFNLEHDTKGVKKLMNPMIAQAMKQEVASLSLLKQVLEGE